MNNPITDLKDDLKELREDYGIRNIIKATPLVISLLILEAITPEPISTSYLSGRSTRVLKPVSWILGNIWSLGMNLYTSGILG